MGDAGVQQLLYLMDQAFDGNRDHSLLSNLGSVGEDDWLWLPPGGGRSIFDLVQHVGECKFVYANHAFGDASMRWDRPDTVPSVERDAPRPEVIEWLQSGQDRLKEGVAALPDDSELLRKRPANWGLSYETRWLINVMIQHDLYHSGEVNHIRALKQNNDR